MTEKTPNCFHGEVKLLKTCTIIICGNYRKCSAGYYDKEKSGD